MKLTLGFSPCPNDTFIFDALVNNKIDTGDLQFDVVLADIEDLNSKSVSGALDITKLSFPALFQRLDDYVMLNSGAALGNGVGPLLVARRMVDLPDVAHCSIAIPGETTTANLLLSFAFPTALNRKPMIFSQIENAVLADEVDLGVVIHEGRFTYRDKGLIKVCDLGEIWEQRTGVPVPLGCIAAHRRVDKDVARQVEALIAQSIAFAYENKGNLPAFVTENAQEMSEDVMRQHIDLYVNNFSLHLNEDGRTAILRLKQAYDRSRIEKHSSSTTSLFL